MQISVHSSHSPPGHHLKGNHLLTLALMSTTALFFHLKQNNKEGRGEPEWVIYIINTGKNEKNQSERKKKDAHDLIMLVKNQNM